jgi:hypothetical protein
MTFTLCVIAFILAAAVLVGAIALIDIKITNKLYTRHADKWLRLREQDHAKRMYDGLAEAEASAMRGPISAADKPSYERYSMRLDSTQPWDMER